MLPKRPSTGIRYATAGELNRRITIQQQATTSDDFGGLDAPTVFASNVPASIKPYRGGRERYAAQQVTAEVSHEIVIRWRPGMKSSMTILYKGRLFLIVTITDPDEQQVELHLLCLERDEGTVGQE